MNEYQWAYSLVDSSRVSTFLISILLIVYGSFRSLNMEQEAKLKEKEARSTLLRDGEKSPQDTNNVQTLDTMQALCLPLGASVSLLVMFFFFDSMQMLFAVATAVVATVALAFLLLPMCQYIMRPCSNGQKISFGVCGRFTAAELASFALSLAIVCVWVLTGHWLLMDAMGMGLCVAFIAFVRLPSLKVSTLLLTGLLIYDVFWVFFSSYIFNANVMVKVATRPADNPVGAISRKLHITAQNEGPKLSLPGKLVFPSVHQQGHFSMLGLGDIVMPGLLLCFVLRYDAYKKAQLLSSIETGTLPPGSLPGTLPPPPLPLSLYRISYFHCSLIGYFLGLLTATVSSEVFKAAQPALLYLVPFTLLPLLLMAYLKGDLRRMWSEPFHSAPIVRHLDV
ncbi:signal peptide peptidase-like 3 isoform X1 [Varroa jacobsoni]|uniref:Signal peptide peptidase-like 3 n=1 Tax=Varroa destructor TaxID=109461 RepID=A0A7M7KQQ5_VARDE|nr:signal peptide peptidase-like 3 isoform X2 [Varroa destructor]XP_022704339.1 signal peptide peptidase-like 3 isoform X1 [Varroa jacobsoni]